MALEQTLSIIKPDAVSKGHVEEICQRLENSGLSIKKKHSLHLDREKAEGFYIEHKGKPFFEDLIDFMTSGPIQVQVLEGDDAITHFREVMGSTNPKEAAPGTLRADLQILLMQMPYMVPILLNLLLEKSNTSLAKLEFV